ncbi:hypothetical protein DPMN_093640 [Dreissena polymorpha]|uniref:Uncharacterized protein n=1 Tax=Dreissena polymorpha TaxID=45954 RepID=A0A9D4R165_DREPO|nr:hypothetical protein DPMN_093640 [Dreissena polymorpha]
MITDDRECFRDDAKGYTGFTTEEYSVGSIGDVCLCLVPIVSPASLVALKSIHDLDSHICSLMHPHGYRNKV